MPRPSHSPWFDTNNRNNSEESKLWSSSLYNLLQALATSSLLSQNIILCTLFSSTLHLYSSLNVREHVTPLQNRRQNYRSVYYNTYAFRQQLGGQKFLDWMIWNITRIQSPFNFPLNQILICYHCPQNINCATFSKSTTLCCILAARKQHTVNFLYVFF